MNEAIFSGVLAKIYEQVCEFLGETYHEIKTEVENSYHRYDKSYKDRHGQLKVFCTGMRKPIPLDEVYVAVQFLDKHTVSRYSSPEDVEQAFRERDRRPFGLTLNGRQDGTQVANAEQYLMLLGAPGVGKSTFLRKVGLEALKGKTGTFAHECMPVFLELKRFTEKDINIETLITQEFKTCGYPHPKEMTNAALESGTLLVLFDGLDEVPRANVANVIDKIGVFVDQYSQNRFIASCRIAAYTGGFTRFTEVEMADFDDFQIQAYIKKWFDSTPDPHLQQLDESMNTVDRCWKMLNASEHSATKELARNPLLLTLLCMIYDSSQNFPRNRANLYEDALNIFLREWAAEKRVNRGASITQYLDIADEKRMLSEIATKNFQTNCLFFSKDELITQIQEFGEGNANTLETFNAPKILNTILIDQGLFVERVRGSYSFSHLTFHEYLTADYIVKHPTSIAGLVTAYLHNAQWREVFLLTSGLMHEADDLLQAMATEAAKSINTPGLKALFRWTERITGLTNDSDIRIAKRLFAIRQYFSLWLLNKIHEGVKGGVDRDLDLYRHLYHDRDFDLYRRHYLDFDLYRYLDFDLYSDLYDYFDPYRAFYRDLNCYLYRDLYFDPDRDPYRHLYLYRDLYQYTDTDFYPFLPSEYTERFDKELENRIEGIEYIGKKKIFTRVDLQQMVRRFNAQREFIKAARRGEFIEPPIKSIYDTWLSVLHITDELLATSREELENYSQYLQAVELIIACKEGAGRVSPDVWKGIETGFFTVDPEKGED